jgi:hypothetical protein
MAKQGGHHPLRGTIGDISYRKTQDGYIGQQKSSLTRKRFLTDPAFENSRKASNEFGTAGKGASMLNKIFTEGIRNCCDNRIQSRLTRKMLKVLDTDTISPRGERSLLWGDITLLRDFWWNKQVSISSALGVDCSVKVDRHAGAVRFRIRGFIPDESLKVNPNATHFKITASSAAVDWLPGNKATAISTEYIKVDNKKTRTLDFVIPVRQETTLPVVSCLAISWYQHAAGEMYALYDMDYNTAGIMDVNVQDES